MNIQEIKAAVDAGHAVHWANEGYVVHLGRCGDYLITFTANGSTVGLTDRIGTSLGGASDLFFISRPDLGVQIRCQECGSTDVMREAWAIWDETTQSWAATDLQDNAYCNACNHGAKLAVKPVRDYGAPGSGACAQNHGAAQGHPAAGVKVESKLSEG